MALDNWTFWDYPTNYNGGDNVSSASDFFLNYPYYITEGLSANVLIIFVFLVFLAMGLPFGMGAALAAASFISFILSTFLWWNGIIGATYPITFFVITLVSAIVIGNSRK